MNHYPRRSVSCLVAFFSFLIVSKQTAGQGTHVFAGAEYAIFSEYALNTGASAAWTTDRSSAPGYFSAIADARFEGATPGTSFLVDGYIKYYRGTSAISNSFEFAVGQGTAYRPIVISGIIPVNAIFAGAWFNGDASVVVDPTDGTTHDRASKGTGVVSVLPQGFWDWESLAGSAIGMTISVNIPDVSGHAQTSNLILVGWDGMKWINLSGAAGAGPYANNWASGNSEGAILVGSWQAGITALAIGSLSTILPVKLESFTGKINECSAELTWKTAEEENTSHFNVQSSKDGSNWVSVTTINAQGYGAGQIYRYNLQQNERLVRYRLLMADKDGQVKLSHVITLSSYCGQDESLKVFPNPVMVGDGSLKIVMQTTYRGKANVLIQNSAGQLIQKINISLSQGHNTIDLSTHSLVPGTYLLSVFDEAGQRLHPIKKIIKK